MFFSRMSKAYGYMSALGRGMGRGAMGFGRGVGRMAGRYPYLTGFTGGVAATGAAIGFGGGRRNTPLGPGPEAYNRMQNRGRRMQPIPGWRPGLTY